MRISEYPGCCTMKVLSNFNDVPVDLRKAIKPDETWTARNLAIALQGADLKEGAHWAFTGASDQNGAFSPFAFAEFLTERGETVVQTGPRRHDRHGNEITAFLWTPSDDFLELYARCAKRWRDGTGSYKRATGAERPAPAGAAAPAAGRAVPGARRR